MNIKPLSNRVVIKPFKKEEQTIGGIILPDTLKEEPSQEGIVVAVGKGKLNQNGEREPVEVTIGDKIMFSKNSGTEIEYENENYLIMPEYEIIAIL